MELSHESRTVDSVEGIDLAILDYLTVKRYQKMRISNNDTLCPTTKSKNIADNLQLAVAMERDLSRCDQ